MRSVAEHVGQKCDTVHTSSNRTDSSSRNCCDSTGVDSKGKSRISMAALRDKARESRWYEGVYEKTGEG